MHLKKDQQMKENDVKNKEILDVGTISFLDNVSDQNTQFLDDNPPITHSLLLCGQCFNNI